MARTQKTPGGYDFPARLIAFTEMALTSRLKRKLREKMRQQRRNPVLDWVLAILWAACFVLVINQYVFQNYRIPSGSMEKTLLIGDMIFVDKFSLGPELLPGVAKMPGLSRPSRGQIIVFENPSYLSRGPAYTILQQMLYMLSLTLVDIDRDENGEQRVHYLIKRQVGMEGDRIRVDRGEVSIMPAGASAWMPEKTLMEGEGLPFKARRQVAATDYAKIEAAGSSSAMAEAGLRAAAAGAAGAAGGATMQDAYKDAYGFDGARLALLSDMYPHEARVAEGWRRQEMGWYIAPGRVFPMGDNRDDSRDARYFGPVAENRVLGRAKFIYWPLTRSGGVR